MNRFGPAPRASQTAGPTRPVRPARRRAWRAAGRWCVFDEAEDVVADEVGDLMAEQQAKSVSMKTTRPALSRTARPAGKSP